MRQYKRSEIRDVYHDYMEHLREEHPLFYERNERFFKRYV